MKNWKKCTAAILAAVFCILTTVTVFAEIDNFINADWDKNYISGDLNDDGSVTPDDIVLMRQYLAGLLDDSAVNTDAADLDYSGTITPDDLLVLRKMVAGLI